MRYVSMHEKHALYRGVCGQLEDVRTWTCERVADMCCNNDV